jgi:hypothetical protein
MRKSFPACRPLGFVSTAKRQPRTLRGSTVAEEEQREEDQEDEEAGAMVVAQEELDDRDTPVDIHKLANYENFVSLLEISPSRCERFRPATARWSPEIPRNISSSAPRACQYGSGIRSVYGRQFPIERFPLHSCGALGNSTLFIRDNKIKADEIITRDESSLAQ